jgi:hypothetical protein
VHCRLASALRALALLLVVAASASSAEAASRTPFQIRCEDDISKTVSVLTSQSNGFTVDTSLSYTTLTSMKSGGRPNTFVLGLTKTESRIALAIDGPLLKDPVSGYECVAPQISVRLYYVPVVIYIGREFPYGTCAYNEILTHEKRHLKAYMDFLPVAERTVRAALTNRFGNKPLYAPGGQAKRLLVGEVDTGWLPYIKNQMAKVELLQAAIDTPQEYARLSKACGGQIQSILSKTLRRR